jgi:RNA polymerase sigma-70 factor (ECF subfamily)
MADVSKHVAAPEGSSEARGRPGADEERELIRLCQKGAHDAFEELIRRHQQRVFSVVRSVLRRHEDVEDVAQQVFIKAYVSIRSFDMRAAFSTWLYKIAVNECWDYLRKKKVRPLMYESDLSTEQVQMLGSFLTPDTARVDASQRVEIRELAEFLLSQVDVEDRQMLVLKEVEGLSVQEISELFNLNVNTVKVRLFRARGRMMEAFERRRRNSKTVATEKGRARDGR